MKLYNKKDFLKLPEGTVYFDKPEIDGQDCLWVGNLHIKGESIKDFDFFHSNINSSWFKNCDDSNDQVALWNKVFSGEDIDLDFDSYNRDGMYDDDDQYYVLNKNEVKEIIKVLTEAYNMAYKTKQE